MMSDNSSIINQEQIGKYLQSSRSYYKSSLAHYHQKNFPKASECLWGAIAETVKALSLKSTGKPVNNHSDIGKFMDSLVGQYENIALTNDLKKAAHELHTYFYETYLNDADFGQIYAKGQKYYGLLQSCLFLP